MSLDELYLLLLSSSAALHVFCQRMADGLAYHTAAALHKVRIGDKKPLSARAACVAGGVIGDAVDMILNRYGFNLYTVMPEIKETFNEKAHKTDASIQKTSHKKPRICNKDAARGIRKK